MSRKTVFILVAIVVLVAAGVFTVMAQDGVDDAPPFGFGMMGGGHGSMMHHGGGMMDRSTMGIHDGSMMTVAAEALGIEPDALFDALHDGQTLTEIAEAQGIAIETVHEAMLAQAEEHMAAGVAAGSITQEQADQHLTWMRENIAEMPMVGGSATGPCMNGQTGMGSRMMGHGHGRGMMGM